MQQSVTKIILINYTHIFIFNIFLLINKPFFIFKENQKATQINFNLRCSIFHNQNHDKL